MFNLFLFVIIINKIFHKLFYSLLMETEHTWILFQFCEENQGNEGFYNLKGDAGFEGHLNLDSIATIQFQSKNHRGRESHALVFVNKNGETVFKIFIGRDANGELLQNQMMQFEQLRQRALAN